MSITCLQSEIDTGESELLRLKNRISKFTSVSSVGSYFCIDDYKHDMVVVIKIVAHIYAVQVQQKATGSFKHFHFLSID